MNSPHGDVGPELRRLAQAILDRLDPTLRAAASAAMQGAGPGRCQQVWCPVCALAALIAGEQHPLLTVVAEHSVALLAMLNAMVAQAERAGEAQAAPPPPTEADTAPPPPGARGDGAGTGNGASRYQHIPIVVEPAPADD